MSRVAVDPGREKFGWAFAEGDRLLCSGIAPAAAFAAWCETVGSGRGESLAGWRLEGNIPARLDVEPPILLGDGTASGTYAEALRAAGLFFRLTDERGSTLAARPLFWSLHPPRGWRRLLPLSLQLPPRPLDDLAAWVLLLREKKP